MKGIILLMCLFGLCASVPLSHERAVRSSSNEGTQTRFIPYPIPSLNPSPFFNPQQGFAPFIPAAGSGQDDLLLSLLLLTTLFPSG
ncbi:hypothetical protein AAFF_G00358630 [Aldrovandia affinis]|uniref:Uncharacterized protein n=1 Tax=Aldrovandia affinis TaxID=143900 RepID=A0AAD7T909_9TELE|nr:hypothetical protein AAFF_G00358630 [Aldrovandia affinis]